MRRSILLAVGILLGVPTIILIISGLVVLRMVRSATPEDLGIRVSTAEIDAVVAKVGVKIQPLPEDTDITASIRHEGTRQVSYTLDSTEVTALIAAHSRFRYFPLHSIQVRINPDGSVRASGVLDPAKILPYAKAIGYETQSVQQAMQAYKLSSSRIPFTLQGTGTVRDGNVSLSLDSIAVASIPVPKALFVNKQADIIHVIEQGIAHTPGLSVQSLAFDEGKLQFAGSIPDKELYVQ